MIDALVQLGLVFELAGAFILATPGFWIPDQEHREHGLFFANRWPYPYTLLPAIAATCATALLAFVVISYNYWRVFLWALALATLAAWLPLLSMLASECLPEAGEPWTDEQRAALHSRGFGLLAVGFIFQSLGAALR